MRYLVWMILAAARAQTLDSYSYWIQPCSRETSMGSSCEAADLELAQWALDAWQKAGGGRLLLERTEQEARARIRIYWAAGNLQRYGEMRPIVVDGRSGAAVYVRPDLAELGPEIAAAGRDDRLFRHAIVYLTCLHETGHAFGLAHTAAFDDIMYSFGHGGDIVEYFSRYRRKLTSREDIRRRSGISRADQDQLGARLAR